MTKYRHKFWYMVNKHVKFEGPFVPLNIFKRATQSVYSKTKSGVDGATHQRAIICSSTSHFQWEHKLVSQIVKTVSVNSFLS